MNEEIKNRIVNLIDNQQSLLLSTIVSSEPSIKESSALPESSYAPYYCDLKQQRFYIMLSDLANHTSNLRANPNASILIIEDEQNAEQMFARTRVQFSIKANQLQEAKEIEKAKTLLKKRFGEMIDVLGSLKDFNIFSLTPLQGSFVEGFGKAITIKKGLYGGLSPTMQDRNN